MSVKVYGNEYSGPKLASVLADKLTDLEFELLLRKRILNHTHSLHVSRSNLEERHTSVDFSWISNDSNKWTVSVGETYSKCVSAVGEVLSNTFDDATNMMDMKDSNKLCLLLPAPLAIGVAVTTAVTTDDDDYTIPF